MLNLDTHILINALTGHLTPPEEKLLKRDPKWCVSGIVLWEIFKLHQIGRIRFGLDYPPLAAALDQVEVIPVNLLVCKTLAHLDFRSDPADEMIGSTSLAYDIPLVTRDAKILASKLIRFPLSNG
jgi:PIN domain nuclease of toxin-antitoxin system